MAGTLLVVGSAPCLHEDVERAFSLRPLAAIMLVNGACTAIERAEHVLAGHTEKAEWFAKARREKFPNAPPWRLHATEMEKYLERSKKRFPCVTDWHGKQFCTGATSIAKGAKIGLLALGFDEVILCGAPMDGSGYSKDEAIVPQEVNMVRVGDPRHHTGYGIDQKQRHRTVQRYRNQFARFAKEFEGRVFSMSGYTRECCGEPR
jgi:hypothetical protein